MAVFTLLVAEPFEEGALKTLLQPPLPTTWGSMEISIAVEFEAVG